MSSSYVTPNCFITNLPLNSDNFVPSSKTDSIEYKLRYAGKDLFFRFSDRIQDWSVDIAKDEKEHPTYELGNYINRVIEPLRYILLGLILNNKWIPKGEMLDIWKINEIVKAADYPQSPKDKLDNLLIHLCNLQKFDGEEFELRQRLREKYSLLNDSELPYIFYFKMATEFRLYMNTLLKKNLIFIYNSEDWAYSKTSNVTFEGLSYVIDITNEGQFSKNCFIAMSFDPDEYSLYTDAFKPACEETGFVARRIDYENYDSDKTINDAMIALIKSCKFMIADFTKQKHNVYFETGFGLGRDMKIIYTCRKDHFAEAKFDTNHFPHIVYESTEDLKKKLIDKIKAFILQ